MIPRHYSRDIAERCDYLIAALMPVVQNGLPGDARFGGPLGTTFLLTMGATMVLLPVERIVKAGGSADERSKDRILGKAVTDVLSKPFSEAPFGQAGLWSYVTRHVPTFNTASKWPSPLLHSLAEPRAIDAARKAPTGQILRDLRNALAHGSIAYLDEQGRQSGREAAMLAFAGAVMKKNRITALNILRIRQDEYRRFLSAWAAWLRDSGLTKILNERAA